MDHKFKDSDPVDYLTPRQAFERGFEGGKKFERERAAKIAENMGRSNGRVLASHKRIAEQIRAGFERIVTLAK